MRHKRLVKRPAKLFCDLEDPSEEDFYGRIWQAWEDAELNEEDADLLLSRLILNILEEDRRRAANRERTLMRILTNCLILVLALCNNASTANLGTPFSDLPVRDQRSAIRELGALIAI